MRDKLGRFLTYEATKYRARSLARQAIAAGGLVVGPCEICGITDGIDAHHDNYNEPLRVRWLCRRHHAEYHREHRKKFGPRKRTSDPRIITVHLDRSLSLWLTKRVEQSYRGRGAEIVRIIKEYIELTSNKEAKSK